MDLENLPIANGIVYSNGFMEPIEIMKQSRHSRVLYKHNKCKVNSENLDYSDGYASAEIILNSKKQKIVCGGGSYGGDGFVLATALESGEMLWLASFDESNPFISIYEKDQYIYVTNNCEEVWQFKIIRDDCVEINIVKDGLYYGCFDE